MFKKLFGIMLIIILVSNNSTFVLANTQCQLKGDIKQVNKLYDGDTIFLSDFIIDGNFTDESNNVVDITDCRLSLQERAYLGDTIIRYSLYDNRNTIIANGTTKVEILEFNPTLNPSKIDIEPYLCNVSTDSKYYKDDIINYLARQIKDLKFTNNLGKEIKIDEATWNVDVSNIKSEIGTYKADYSIGFYSNNTLHKYNVLSGTIGVNVVSNDKFTLPKADNSLPDNTTISTNNKVYLESVGQTYILSVNNVKGSSTCSWTSSDPSKVTVNSKSGLLKSINKGTVTITCEIKDEDGTTNKLTTKVIVGNVSEDAPSLSDTELNLDAGDDFDLNVNNKISGSLYKYKTSNSDIVSVKTFTGKGKGMSEGEETITCTITTPDKTVYVRKCVVKVE